MPVLKQFKREAIPAPIVRVVPETPEGGLGVYITNKTGAASVKGTIVEPHDTVDRAIKLCGTSSINPSGVIYTDGVADGSEVLVIFSGLADCLVNDTEAIDVNDWAGTSNIVAGRAQGDPSPPATSKHDQEIGHFIEAAGAGTDVLVRAFIHFR